MAKLPTFRRFTLEDFQSQKDWITKLFYPLNQFLSSVVTALSNQLTFADNLDAQVAQITVNTSSQMTLGAATGTSVSQTFVDANVSTVANSITLTAHPFITGNWIRFSTSGVLPTGLVAGTDYYVIRIDANTIKTAISPSNAYASTVNTISSAAGGGTHTVQLTDRLPPYVALQSSAQLSVTTKAVPKGLTIWSCFEQSTNPSVQRYAIAPCWTYSNGLITISHISGLEPSKTYLLTLVITGG